MATSPGWTVPDSGAGLLMIGEKTLGRHETRLARTGRKVVREAREAELRFGNDSSARATEVAVIPIAVGRHRGEIRAFVVPGAAPLLLSANVMSLLRAVMDYDVERFDCRALDESMKMARLPSGHYEVDTADFEPAEGLEFAETPLIFGNEITIWAPKGGPKPAAPHGPSHELPPPAIARACADESEATGGSLGEVEAHVLRA